MKPKCIILLSTHSSGSSALQKLLTDVTQARTVNFALHSQNETLFWLKAAMALDLEQKHYPGRYKIPQQQARADLLDFLSANLPENLREAQLTNKKEMFDAWIALCRAFAPILFEKSPQHLPDEASLKLILECIEERQHEVDFLLIGLVRNPLDTIYSHFERWKLRPETAERKWALSYKNLLEIEKRVPVDKLVTLRYEDITASIASLSRVYEFCGVNAPPEQSSLHRKSVSKWKNNPFFGFKLSRTSIELAKLYGYTEEELSGQRAIIWPLYREIVILAGKLRVLFRTTLRPRLKELRTRFGF